jgi:hypothetical protein
MKSSEPIFIKIAVLNIFATINLCSILYDVEHKIIISKRSFFTHIYAFIVYYHSGGSDSQQLKKRLHNYNTGTNSEQVTGAIGNRIFQRKEVQLLWSANPQSAN